MNKDRGTIKWNALMLPEHIQRLREWHKDTKKVQRKQLTEWELQAFDEMIREALTTGETLRFTLYKNDQLIHVTGSIQAVDQQKRQLHIKSEEAIYLIDFHAIQAIDPDD